MALQFKGTTAAQRTRLAKIIDGCLFGCNASIANDGTTTLVPNKEQGMPTASQANFKKHIQSVISDPKPTVINVKDGDATIFAGSYDLCAIDLKDMETFGGQPANQSGFTAWSALIHEVIEQYKKQVKGLAYDDVTVKGKTTTGAHNCAVAAENDVSGATRTSLPPTTLPGGGTEFVECFAYPKRGTVYFKIVKSGGKTTGPTKTSAPPKRGYFSEFSGHVDLLRQAAVSERIDDYVAFARAARALEDLTGILAQTDGTYFGRVYTQWSRLGEDVEAWSEFLERHGERIDFDVASWQFVVRPEPSIVTVPLDDVQVQPQLTPLMQNVRSKLVETVELLSPVAAGTNGGS